MDHYHVIMDGFRDREKQCGDVITLDGEFCRLVKEWHEQREAQRVSGPADI